MKPKWDLCLMNVSATSVPETGQGLFHK